MTPPLKGRRAFVTGGSRGIGAGIVRRLAEDGARVVFTYSSSAQQAADVVDDIKEDGGWARAVKADVADPTSLRRPSVRQPNSLADSISWSTTLVSRPLAT